MKNAFLLLVRSLWHRRFSFSLSLFSVVVSLFFLLGIFQVSKSVRSGFERGVAGVDLVVAARDSGLSILLYSLYGIGSPTRNMSFQAVQKLQQHPDVDWVVPISLGDSHRGYRVVGTTTDFFKRFKWGDDQILGFQQGLGFDDVFEVVLGSEVAKRFNYQIDQEIFLSHGTGDVSFVAHEDFPFKIVGILEPTGTSFDQNLYVSLEAIEAIHIGWEDGAAPEKTMPLSEMDLKNLIPESITSALVRLKSAFSIFYLQEEINQKSVEPLTAVLPGVVLNDLWRILQVFERSTNLIAMGMALCSFLGFLATLVISLNDRRREILVLRAIGFQPLFIFSLMILEGLALGVMSIVFALIFWIVLEPLMADLLLNAVGFYLVPLSLDHNLVAGALIILALGVISAVLPAWRLYKTSLSAGFQGL